MRSHLNHGRGDWSKSTWHCRESSVSASQIRGCPMAAQGVGALPSPGLALPGTVGSMEGGDAKTAFLLLKQIIAGFGAQSCVEVPCAQSPAG